MCCNPQQRDPEKLQAASLSACAARRAVTLLQQSGGACSPCQGLEYLILIPYHTIPLDIHTNLKRRALFFFFGAGLPLAPYHSTDSFIDA